MPARYPRVKKVNGSHFQFLEESCLTLPNEDCLYGEFIKANDKDTLIQAAKSYGLTSDPLIAHFILEDGSIVGVHAPGDRFIHSEQLKIIRVYGLKGFSYRGPEHCKLIMIKWFCIYTNSLRMRMSKNVLAVQCWIHQSISKAQWDRINYLIRLGDSELFAWDLELDKGKRLSMEVSNPQDCNSLKEAYLQHHGPNRRALG